MLSHYLCKHTTLACHKSSDLNIFYNTLFILLLFRLIIKHSNFNFIKGDIKLFELYVFDTNSRMISEMK